MFSFAKVRKINIILILIFIISINHTPVQAQKKYSIDKERKIKKPRKHFSFRHLFKKSTSQAAAKQVRKDDKHMTKVMTAEQKANKKYQKKANSDKEKGKDWKVYKRMKKYEKQAKRRREHKHKKTFFQRLFSTQKQNKRKKA